MPIHPVPGGSVTGDTGSVKLGGNGEMSPGFATSVGFDPNASPTSLAVTSKQQIIQLIQAATSVTLDRSMVAASTVTITVEDPTRRLVNSSIAQVTDPTPPSEGGTPTTTVTKTKTGTPGGIHITGGGGTVPPVDLWTSTTTNTMTKYYPTRLALTDGTTTLYFCLVSISKQQNTLTLTFEDQLINQLRYCYNPSGSGHPGTGFTRGQFCQWVVNTAMKSMSGNVIRPDGLYFPSSKFTDIQDVSTANQTATWGTSEDPTQDAWSAITNACNTAQWRCFSTGKYLVWGPDAWLLANPVSDIFTEFTDGCDDVDYLWDIGQPESQVTVNLTDSTRVKYSPGSVCQVKGLGILDTEKWLLSDMSRELHQPTATLTLVQPQPALTEQEISDTELTTGTGVNSSGQSTVSPGNLTGSANGESAMAARAVSIAKAQVGKWYQLGAVGPATFDCSGLMYYSYNHAGWQGGFPRTSEDQYNAGWPSIDQSELLPGDLLFYEDGTFAPPGHVTMYIGAGQIVQAPYTGAQVQIINVWFGSTFMGARRPTQ